MSEKPKVTALEKRAEQERERLAGKLVALCEKIPQNLFYRRYTLKITEDNGDNSFPPDKKNVSFTYESLYCIVSPEYEEIKEGTEFYGPIYYSTKDPGLFVSEDGNFYRVHYSGSATYSPFAAHPGYAGMKREREFIPVVAWKDVPINTMYQAIDNLKDWSAEW